MGKRSLLKTSFSLLRTNPRLTTNVKILFDSKDKVYLESFDEIEELSDSKFKGVEVTGGEYAFDVFRFWEEGKFPKEIAYKVYQNFDLFKVKDSFSKQYEMVYTSGAYAKASKLYDEDFAFFAPLWVEKENIPDYFIIFKTEGPVSANMKHVFSENELDGDVGVKKFFDNIIKKSKILKVFDLTARTNQGKYILSHANNEFFPESPLYVDFGENRFTKWKGISFLKGGFCESGEFIHDYAFKKDKTIIEFENFITNGYQRHGIICANLLNLEFLFTDEEAEKYEINRYFGLYCNMNKSGEFEIDEVALFDDRLNEKTQVPVPKDAVIDFAQTNEKGTKVHLKNEKGFIPASDCFQKEFPRIAYIKDQKGNFYTIKPCNDSKEHELRLMDKRVDWNDFKGFKEKGSVRAFMTNKRGRSHIAFEIKGRPSSGDQIRLKYCYDKESDYILHADNIELHTITADASLPPKQTDGLKFSCNGNLDEIAFAIKKSLESIKNIYGEPVPFKVYLKGRKIIVYSMFENSLMNKTKIQFFMQNYVWLKVYGRYMEELDFDTVAGKNYCTIPFGGIVFERTGYFLETFFYGGSERPENRVVVENKDLPLFNKDAYLLTDKGFKKAKGVYHYLDEYVLNGDGSQVKEFKNLERYGIIETEGEGKIKLNSNNKTTVFERGSNEAGFLSFYPVKDFDFDFFNEDYNKNTDSEPDRLLSYLKENLKDENGILNPGLEDVLNGLLGEGSSWKQGSGFLRLIGDIDDEGNITQSVFNEYDRLKENYNPYLSTVSRVVPFINKWVMDDFGKDVRENGYRLNVSESFGYSNFSPSFREFRQNPKFFTHEWYYLQKYPSYFTLEDKINSFSYFEEELNIEDLMDVEEDKFLKYFVQDFVIDPFTGNKVDIPTKFKYSVFSGGNEEQYAQTFFRGAKIEIRERINKDQTINFNLDSILTKSSSKFNGYKFSAVLVFDEHISLRIIKNEKFKTITFVIGANLTDGLFIPYEKENRFIDRVFLYVLQHKYDKKKLLAGNTNDIYQDMVIPGAVEIYKDGLNVARKSKKYKSKDGKPFLIIEGTTNAKDGSLPVFKRDIQPNLEESFGDLKVFVENFPRKSTDGLLIFKNIIEIQNSSFICEKVLFQRFGSNNVLELNDMAYNPRVINKENVKCFNPVYSGGGFNSYKSILEEISFAKIAEKINSGSPEVEYITVKENGEVVKGNDFILRFIEPQVSLKVTNLKAIEDNNKPTKFSISNEKIGYLIENLNRVFVSRMERYNGYYCPRFYDVLFFVSDVNNLQKELEGKVENIDDLTDNTTFGQNQKGFGLIKNFCFFKVNTKNPNGVLKLSTNDSYKPVYSLIDEVAFHKSDFDVFLSNWDSGYFYEFLDSKTFVKKAGSRSMLEKPSFFGSKLMKVPEKIEIETFDASDAFNDLFKINNIDVYYKKEFNTLELQVFCNKSLVKYFLNDGIQNTFDKYLNLTVLGSQDSIEDKVWEYANFNLINLYEVESIELFEYSDWERKYDFLEFGLSETEKYKKGFRKVNNFRVQFLTDNKLKFKLLYNFTSNKEVSLSLKVVLRKK